MFEQNYYAPKAQAKAVRAYLEMYDGVEPSYSNGSYAPIRIAEWYNGRERGYVISFNNAKNVQINIAFYEHRNSDCIDALRWIENTINPPTLASKNLPKEWLDHGTTSHTVGYGAAHEMAEWIYEQLVEHWNGVA